jgi:hypothetical protein
MKITILILINLTFLSCNKNSQSDKSGDISTIDSKVNVKDELLGEWGIYVIGNAYCNACPRVVFKVNGTGTIIFPAGRTEQIGWKKKHNKLEIKNISNSDNNLFQSTEYSMTYSKKAEYLELELTHSTDGPFILRK